MSEQTEALLAVAHCLETASVPYMISGSTAMNFYARPRMTRDIDIVIELPASEVGRLVDVLSDDFYIDDEMAVAAARDRHMFNVVHNATMTKIDFIVRKDEPYRQAEFERRRRLRLGGATLFVVAPEDLVLSKLVWSVDSGSDTQAIDVRNLLATGELDEEYLTVWAGRLGVGERLDALRP